MIGFQILAIEQPDRNYLCDKVDPFFSVEINLLKYEAKTKNCPENIQEEASILYDLFGKKDKEREFILTKDELRSICFATTCREEDIGTKGYHKLACDGIIIIPITKNDFISGKDFLNNN